MVPGITCGCSKVEMLYRCNFLALTGNENCSHLPSTKVWLISLLELHGHFKLQVGIWDCETRKFVADLSFSSEVRRVRLTKDMIIIGLDRMIKVFSFTRPPSQIKVLETGMMTSRWRHRYVILYFRIESEWTYQFIANVSKCKISLSISYKRKCLYCRFIKIGRIRRAERTCRSSGDTKMIVTRL